MAPVVEKVLDPVVLGEGPHWDTQQQCLYYVSVLEGTIHKYVPATETHTKTKLDGTVGFIIPVEGVRDQFVVGVDNRIAVVRWGGEEGAPAETIKQLAEVDKHTQVTQLNDAKCDPRGRLFAGTMGRETSPGEFEKDKGSLYRVEGNASLKVMAEKVSLANGLAWDLSRCAFYYIDSLDHKVRRYDYDISTGEIANQQFIFDFKANNLEGLPDGMTIDTDGNLWIACFLGSQVIKVDPTSGKLLQTVAIPASQVTSVAFGGENLDELYVTSGSMGQYGPQEPPCGSTFRVTGLGVKGMPMTPFKLRMAPVVEKVLDPVLLGEGPHWDTQQQCLYYVSILEGTIHKYVPATETHTKTKLDGNVGFIIPVEGMWDQFVVGVDHRVEVVRWGGEEGAPVETIKLLAEVDQHTQVTQLNDAKCDPRGRLFAGTTGRETSSGEFEKDKGSLYRVEGNGCLKVLAEKVSIANGLAWDVSRRAFYYIDTLDHKVQRYDYDISTGEIANKQFIFDFKANNLESLPDGMTIDTDGNLWIACFLGSQVIKVDPTSGKLLQAVAIPALQVTSVAFGGENRDELYVTSGSMERFGTQGPLCGSTFRVTGLGVKGMPMTPFKL